MERERIKKIVVAGAMSAIAIFLGATRLGFIPWFAGASLTIMAVPVIIGAILEGPVVGFVIGLIFGVFSLIQAAVAPQGPTDVWFVDPLVSVLPRLFIGPAAWFVFRLLARWKKSLALVLGAVAGSLTNTILVLGMLGIKGLIPWTLIGTIALVNGLPEAIAGAIITAAVVGAWWKVSPSSEQWMTEEQDNMENEGGDNAAGD